MTTPTTTDLVNAKNAMDSLMNLAVSANPSTFEGSYAKVLSGLGSIKGVGSVFAIAGYIFGFTNPVASDKSTLLNAI